MASCSAIATRSLNREPRRAHLATEFDDIDERIVEVDAPVDFDARDIVRDISLPTGGET